MSLWLHYKFRLGSISNLYAVTPMFAIAVDTDRESSRNVIPEPPTSQGFAPRGTKASMSARGGLLLQELSSSGKSHSRW
jgi:hypothetical protein